MDVEEAKKIAAGPLGEMQGKFPLLFAKAVLIVNRPSVDGHSRINNGSVTLLEIGGRPIGVTSQHVIECFRKRHDSEDGVIFQVGNVELDPLSQLIDEDADLDLATFYLTDIQVDQITSEGEIGSCIFRPKAWPPPAINKEDFVSFGGFPGNLRIQTSFDEVDFYSWSCGASMISSVSECRFVSAFERDYWVRSFGQQHHMELTALGGMSGGPVFISRGLYWDLVGIVSHYHENYDAIFFASIHPIQEDGSIAYQPVGCR